MCRARISGRSSSSARESLGRLHQEYFAAGLTEEITARLAQLKTLRVVSRTSAMSLRDRKVPVSTIARELAVDAVVEGSVRREGGRVRISIQLIDAPTDTHLWARDFEREATATWPLQIEVAQAVADEIRVQATPEERRAWRQYQLVSPAAHEEYLLGRHLLWKFIEEVGCWPSITSMGPLASIRVRRAIRCSRARMVDARSVRSSQSQRGRGAGPGSRPGGAGPR